MIRRYCTALGASLLAASVSLTAGPVGGTAQVSAILVARTDDGVRVTIRGTGRVVPELVSAVGQLPPRIVIDLPEVGPGVVPGRIDGMDQLLAVRIGTRANGSTRVTLDLDQPMTYRVLAAAAERGTLMVDLIPTTPQRPAVSAESETVAAAAAPSPSPQSPLVRAAAAAQAAQAALAARAARVTGATSQTPTLPRPANVSAVVANVPRPTGRASFYTHGAQVDSGDVSRRYGEFTSSITFQLPDRGGDGLEYGLDLRHSAYTLEGRQSRLSVYDAYVGQRLAGGTVGVRAGHMWLNELGGMGAFAGGLFEVRQPATQTGGLGRWRGGVFGGLEPRIYETGYADRVRKAGGYVVLEGARSRRHVLGYVQVRNGNLTERSALSFTNYVPVGAVSIYQAGEYDLAGPGGMGKGGLSYFFTNARAPLGKKVELMGTFNRGRSIDVRGVSEDILSGRPVSQRAIEGLLYRSMGGRVTVEVMPRVRAYVGYARDRNNRDDADTGRWLAGGYASDVFHSGLDVTLSDSRLERASGSYHSTYFSLGRQIGRRLYVTGDYTTSLALVRFVRGDGVLIELQPHTRRFGGSGVLTLSRSLTLLVSAEETLDDDVTELRVLSGLTVRFR